MTQFEKLARALHAVDLRAHRVLYSWDELHEDTRQSYYDDAKYLLKVL